MSPDESLNVDSVAALNAGAGWSVLVDDDQTPVRRLDDERFTLHGVNSTRVELARPPEVFDKARDLK